MGSVIKNDAVKLFLCGALALFWELVLIRWLGSCVRIVAYYSNFVLISAFFGLGAGALLGRFSNKFRLWSFIFLLVFLCILSGPFLGSFDHANPNDAKEFIWAGVPKGIFIPTNTGVFPISGKDAYLPYWLILLFVYLLNTVLFLAFGQWLSYMFKKFSPLKSYSIEIAGSIAGILLFACLSIFKLSPIAWFFIGFVMLLLITDINYKSMIMAFLCAIAIVVCIPFSNQFNWSAYYKISVMPFNWIVDKDEKIVPFDKNIGYALSVNNDYHQMILDLQKNNMGNEHPFLKAWRDMYDTPYKYGRKDEPKGKILIVGAGTGNDVSAALRNTDSEITAVEIDPKIVFLGKELHFEKPYSNPRVNLIVNDARSFFVNTKEQYAKVVFGYLDSHTLMTSFSSLRLDNFVYTYESLKRVKEILLPGGSVYITFGSNHQWMHNRFVKLVETVFGGPVTVFAERTGVVSGYVYMGRKKTDSEDTTLNKESDLLELPTDDWPYLYLKKRSIPNHYITFMGIVIVLAIGTLFILPKGQRRLRLPYFFLGAGFFLLETTNVVSLSLLYGSTWVVNVTVFTGILVLVLLGTIACFYMKEPRFKLIFTLLFISLFISYVVPVSELLKIDGVFIKAFIGVVVFLSPVFFASLIFGHLIKTEESLVQAYGSNILGAVIGGCVEYISLITGIKFLIVITLIFYVCVVVLLKGSIVKALSMRN